MKIFIIGGSGLISTALKDLFIENQDEVILYNRGVTPLRGLVPSKQISGDRDDLERLGSAIAQEQPDVLVDMVCMTSMQAKDLLRLSQRNVKQIILCSTVCVYGGPLQKLPADESCPLLYDTDHGEQRSRIEEILLNQEEVNVTIFRPSLTVGAGEIFRCILFDDSLFNRIREGLPIISLDDGSAKRTVTDARDVAAAFFSAALNEGAYGEVFNVSDDKVYTWDEIFNEISKALGAPPPKIVHVDSSWLYRVAPRRSVLAEYCLKHDWVFDVTKAKKVLNFNPKYSIQKVVQDLALWMDREGLTKLTGAEHVQDQLIQAWKTKKVPVDFKDSNPWGDIIKL